MKDATLVRRMQSCTQLASELDGFILWQPADAAQQAGKVFAVEILHREKVQAVRGADVARHTFGCETCLAIRTSFRKRASDASLKCCGRNLSATG